jgi:hypothetical protein
MMATLSLNDSSDRVRCLCHRLGFGSEKHDDACDALVYLILGLVGEGIAPQEIHYV